MIFIVILQTIEICFVDIFGATKVKYSRFVSDCLLMFLCYLKWKSDYRDEELFPGIDSEIPDKILKSLQASRDKGKRWKVLFDIVSILPHYYVQEALCMIMPQSEMICLNSVNLRWMRLLYIIRLPKLFETLDHLLHGEFYTVLRMIELSIYIFLEIFFTAVLWFKMGIVFGFGETEFLPSLEIGSEKNVITKFMHCFHFALHKIDDSNPTNANEITFYFIAISIKSLTEVIIMGQIMSFISQYDASRTEFREKFENVNNFLSTMNAPTTLRKNVHNYFRFLWWRDQGMADPSFLIDHLNDGMISDIKYHLNGKILSTVNIFAEAPDGFIRDLCKRMQSQLYVPGEIIVKKGDPGKEMYLISSGAVAVEGDLGQRFAVLKSGQHFGEMALLFPMLRTATCRAIQYSDIFRLHYDDLHEILQEYPEVLESITKATLNKLETMQGINKETKAHIKRKSMTRRFSLNLGSDAQSSFRSYSPNSSFRSSSPINGTTRVNSGANERSGQVDLDELMIDETLVHDIDEQFDDMMRKNNVQHKIRNRKPRRRVSVSASGTGAKLGAAGTALMSAYAEVNSSGVAQKQRFKDEYTRQKTWSIAKDWHRKTNHQDEVLKVPKNTNGISKSPTKHPKARVIFNSNDLLRQRKLLKSKGPIDLRDHLATLVDPDNVNYLVQNRNKEVTKDASKEKDMRQQIRKAKRKQLERLGVGIVK